MPNDELVLNDSDGGRAVSTLVAAVMMMYATAVSPGASVYAGSPLLWVVIFTSSDPVPGPIVKLPDVKGPTAPNGVLVDCDPSVALNDVVGGEPGAVLCDGDGGNGPLFPGELEPPPPHATSTAAVKSDQQRLRKLLCTLITF